MCLHALECIPDSLYDLLYAYLQDTKKAQPGEQGQSNEEGSEVDLATKEKEKQEEKINALQVIANTIRDN